MERRFNAHAPVWCLIASITRLAACLLLAAFGCSSNHRGSPTPRPELDLSMTFQAEDFQYVSEGEIVPLELFPGWVAVRSQSDEIQILRSQLEAAPGVRAPLQALEAGRSLWLIELQEGLGSEEILDLLARLNGSAGIDFASPVFQAASTRAVVTEEILIKFRSDASPEDIAYFLASRKLGIIRENYPLERCYLVSFSSSSGSNPLVLSVELSSEPLVEYCNPNFLELMEAPAVRTPRPEQGELEPASSLSLQTGQIFYPNVFQDFDWLSSGPSEMPSGWEVLASEDFEEAPVLPNWANQDRDPADGLYFWGAMDDAQFPSYRSDSYPAEGNKGWVAAQHDPPSPDRRPDDFPEGYASHMDTWLVRTVNLSDSLWARLRFRVAFYAPSTEKFGWYASSDGLNWHGNEWEGVGEKCRFYCVWPYDLCWRGLGTPPPNTGIFFYFDNVPEIGDLTGLRNVRVGLRFQSDGVMTAPSSGFCAEENFYGLFIDNILIEHLPASRASSITTDPLSKWQWGLRNTGQSGGVSGYDTHAVPAWDFLGSLPYVFLPEHPSNPVVVAVLDSGVDLSHEDLNVLEGYDARYDPESYYGETVDSRGGAYPWDGHGTACAGIIGARNNSLGVVGVAPGVKILPVRIGSTPTWAEGKLIFATSAQTADGILWAVDHGARILSNSWGGGSPRDVLKEAIRAAVSAGAVVICSSGNDNRDWPAFPASYEDTIAVGAMSPCGERKNPSSCDGEWWWGSNYGNAERSGAPQIDVVAPGVLVSTTDITADGGYVPANPSAGKNGNYFLSFSGTSAATPHVAGAAALILSANPFLSAQEVREILQQTAQEVGSPGWDYETGFGLVNAYGAVLEANERRPLDLQPVGLSHADPLLIGAVNLIEVRLLNKGETRSVQTNYRICLSTNNDVIDDSDLLLNGGSVTLEPGEERTFQAQMLVPGVTPAGPAYLILWVDPLNHVAENDETNNQLARPVQLLYPALLSVKPSQVDFGMVYVGSTVSRILTLRNEPVQTPAAILTIASVSLGGNPGFNHPDNLLPSTPYQLAPYQSSQIWLYFSPQEAGSYSGTLTVRSNDPNRPYAKFPFRRQRVVQQGLRWLWPVFRWTSVFGRQQLPSRSATRAVRLSPGPWIFPASLHGS